ncbi:MAG TPA: peptidoglycan-associated lipoprotein Pal [Hypericibacter adhaerens]|jgi:peptidoglycan-associated lipoprotein|uniref:Peptidoglycan-associated lipoprotein n=1 Tax=Hypericibacter adhaerens TaxID=2602016 RepID=A0A5J6N3N0_9PROT|nr:peptidoglycan-associated lipoprotein Pal [Hypericibacter adhaerens]QEX23994.1 peptidoglycan-associated lipoprotein [Hypericibacter adhaerens]HWA44730.1 peptidoglycan-associated lipoprotein Pal [Hypericibacter adhaerens]
MKFKILTAAAAALLLAACSSTPEQSSATDGSSTTGTSTTNSATANTVTPGTLQDFVQNVGDRVFFSYDRYDLTPEAQATLQKQAAWLKSYPQATVVVEGHCDERGTREYNLALGERRAASVANYLVALGIDANRIQTISYGKERPAVDGHDETAWAQNRRGVTVPNVQ